MGRNVGLFKQKEKYMLKRRFNVAKKFASFCYGEPCNIFLYDDYLKIESVDNSKVSKLRYKQIENVSCGIDLFENDSSVVGRTIAGGILLGGIGAVAGAASAVKGRTRKETLTIEYASSSGDIASIMLYDPDSQVSSCNSISKILKTICGLDNKNDDLTGDFL